MELDVKNLVNSEVGRREVYKFELFKEKLDEDLLAERIKGEVELIRLEEEILAKISGSAKIETICDRCLEWYKTEVGYEVDQPYLLDRVNQKDPEALVVSKHFMISLLEPIRQGILVALPQKKLCKSDCLGICQDCGRNRNSKECLCKHTDDK
jgi:uncharacterized protein